ncbi:Hrf1 family protein [Strigomonas culicis]|uniref:Protein YIF1 n=1 Tax=Strigomonas culicis TaxID=28005 RepID=S9UJU4_9TRYP|nr:Hrf1 family protein [Strigomonas culicis]|eukprot:EPY31077.1 Hrf1 family protein [Strigomonas culicis]
MGLQYGQTFVQQGIQQGEQNLLAYMPIVSNLARYFCVSNSYVREAGHHSLPFLRRVPAPELEGGAGTAEDGVSGAPWVRRIPSPSSGARLRQPAPALPTKDAYANDLYIPLMGVTTYIILSAYLHGLVYANAVSTQYLLSTATEMLVWLFLENVVFKLIGVVLQILRGVPVLDGMAVCGYKYVLLCVVLLCRSVFPGNGRWFLFLVFMLYVVSANSFLTFKLLVRSYTQPDGRAMPRARLLAIIATLVQIPCMVRMYTRPLGT